uniref:Uncharacterized protein n=1 Tax=viral metagenome TaxID=1070528 RepID=A0A6C0JJM5_9ZZZZ
MHQIINGLTLVRLKVLRVIKDRQDQLVIQDLLGLTEKRVILVTQVVLDQQGLKEKLELLGPKEKQVLQGLMEKQDLRVPMEKLVPKEKQVELDQLALPVTQDIQVTQVKLVAPVTLDTLVILEQQEHLLLLKVL